MYCAAHNDISKNLIINTKSTFNDYLLNIKNFKITRVSDIEMNYYIEKYTRSIISEEIPEEDNKCVVYECEENNYCLDYSDSDTPTINLDSKSTDEEYDIMLDYTPVESIDSNSDLDSDSDSIESDSDYPIDSILESKCNVNLRRCQIEALDLMNNIKHSITKIMIACGCGKSIIMLEYILQHSLESFTIIVPNINLGNQFYKLFNKFGIYCVKQFTSNDNLNIISKPETKVVVCVYNSFNKIARTFDNYFIDEAHHLETPKFDINIATLPNKKFMFSATLDNPHYKYTTTNAIEDSILAPYNFNVYVINEVNCKSIANIVLEFTEYSHCLLYCNTQENAIRF